VCYNAVNKAKRDMEVFRREKLYWKANKNRDRMTTFLKQREGVTVNTTLERRLTTADSMPSID
jgi:hypothetical protein